MNSARLQNLTNHWGQFEDHVSHVCLAGAVLPSWS